MIYFIEVTDARLRIERESPSKFLDEAPMKKKKGVLAQIGDAVATGAEVVIDAGAKAIHTVGEMMPGGHSDSAPAPAAKAKKAAPKAKAKASPKASAAKAAPKAKSEPVAASAKAKPKAKAIANGKASAKPAAATKAPAAKATKAAPKKAASPKAPKKAAVAKNA